MQQCLCDACETPGSESVCVCLWECESDLLGVGQGIGFFNAAEIVTVGTDMKLSQAVDPTLAPTLALAGPAIDRTL